MAEKEYIEREAAIEKLNKLCERVCQYSKAQRKYMCGACPLGDAFTVIEDAIPAADVVPMDFHERCLQIEIQKRMALEKADVRPVVLCKDCKWYEINELKKDGTEDRRYKPSVCMLAEQRREPNHFCADGKKREES